MKCFLIAAAIAASGVVAPAFATDVGVSVSIGQPGFYGRIDIGNYPPPRVIYRRPVIVERMPVQREPIYLRVPPGHAKHWRRHCREYDACGEPVYFVQDSWYNREYVPRYQELHRDRRDERGDGRYDGREDEFREGGRGEGRGRDR